MPLHMTSKWSYWNQIVYITKLKWQGYLKQDEIMEEEMKPDWKKLNIANVYMAMVSFSKLS